MNWTDLTPTNFGLVEKYRRARVRRVWNASIAPAAEQRQALGTPAIPEPADDADSWYVDTSQEPHFVEASDVAAALQTMWNRQGRPEMAAASDDIAKLVKMFASDRRTSTVSSDVYAMY